MTASLKSHIWFYPPLLALLALVVLSISLTGRAQTTTASLTGTVSDVSGARIPHADVTLTNIDTGIKQHVPSDASGFFSFVRLPVGNYVLRVAKPGFASYVQNGVSLTVGQAAYMPITLNVGSAATKVIVSAAAPLINTTTPTSNQVVTGEQAQALPLNGRNTQDLVNLAAGVRVGSSFTSQGAYYPDEASYSINGASGLSVNYQMDGVDHNDTYLNNGLPFPNPDAIQEFGLQSGNFSAEYGNAAGGIVNIVSKSGTNRFHGSAFEFLRNGSLNAKNYFGTTHDSLHRNQFGATLGGPIVRNKLFFFGSYQGTPTSSATNSNVTFVPTADERTGDFSAITKQLKNPFTGAALENNQIPTDDLDPTAVALLKYVPLPNGLNGQLTYPGLPLRTNDTQYLGKGDYYRGNNQFSGHYFYSLYNQLAVSPKTNIIAATGGNRVLVQTVAINHTYTRTPTLLFNTTFGWSSQTGGSTSAAPFSWSDLGADMAHSNPPELQMSITSGFKLKTNHLGTFDRGDYVVREDVMKIIGKHELHFGGQALYVTNTLVNTYKQNAYFTFNGQLSGNGLSDFMFGAMNQFQQGAGQFKNFAGVQWAVFLQDQWRATDRLTLDMGLRWDPWLPYYDRQGRTVCWVPGAAISTHYPNAPAGMIFGGDAGCPQAGSLPYWPQFGPRVGFGYRLTKSGDTSIRGGFGIYYTPVPTTDYNAMATTAPFAPLLTFSNVDLTHPYQSIGIPNPFPADFGPKTPDSSATFILPTTIGGVFNRNFRPAQTASYNLIIEHEFGRHSMASIAYLGSRSSHLSDNDSNPNVSREMDAAVYAPGESTVANTQSRRTYQDFSGIQEQISSGNGNYNGMQASLEVKTGAGNTVKTSYTWAKSLDDLSWFNPSDQSASYGPSQWNVPLNFKFSDVWNIPMPLSQRLFVNRLIEGWQVDSIVVWQSGAPMTITSGVDNSFSGVGADHADYLGGPISLSSSRSHSALTEEWFNTSAFGPNKIGTFGDARSGMLYGPRYFNTDAALAKKTSISENMMLELRFEAFNIFNNVNFQGPNTTQSSSQFGTITSAASPRILQLGTRLVF